MGSTDPHQAGVGDMRKTHTFTRVHVAHMQEDSGAELHVRAHTSACAEAAVDQRPHMRSTKMLKELD